MRCEEIATEPQEELASRAVSDGVPLSVVVRQLEAEYFCAALNRASGNKAEAARLAGMTYQTFVRKLGEMNLRVSYHAD